MYFDHIHLLFQFFQDPPQLLPNQLYFLSLPPPPLPPHPTLSPVYVGHLLLGIVPVLKYGYYTMC